MADQPLAVIDIGSNSGRMIVARSPTGEHVEILAEERVPLRLARELRDSDRIGDEAIERTVDAVRDFRSLASAAGAVRTIAVATAAVRDASNGAEVLARVSDGTGLEIVAIDGEREAALAFLGAVHSLPIDDGMLLDVGGGSLEVTSFKARKLTRSWTLPLGALRLSDRFLLSDPPSRSERRTLADHVAAELEAGGVEPLDRSDSLVGTGGTIRTLAKMDRAERNYPIPRLHGYGLARERVAELADLVASRTLVKRNGLAGLSSDRADSVVGGAIAVETAMESLGADAITVSGRGLREGIALDTLIDALPPSKVVRAASATSVAARFTTWDHERATRRSKLAVELLAEVEPDAGADIVEMLGHAAGFLDVGAALDPYSRHEQAAGIICSSDLAGFSHSHLALMSAVIRRADKKNAGLKPFKSLLRPFEPAMIMKAATALAVADEVERRLGPSIADAQVRSSRRGVTIVGPRTAEAWSARLAERFQSTFGRSLSFSKEDGS